MGGTLFRPQILRHLTEHNGENVYVEDLCKATGGTVRQVSSCVYNMRRSIPELAEDILVVIPGHVWRYVGKLGVTSGKRASATTNGQLTTTDVPTRPLVLGDDDDDSDDAPTTVTTATERRPPVSMTRETQSSSSFSRSSQLPTARIFEELGVDDDTGAITVISEDGQLYQLLPFGE